jgi:hypothetical protein
VPADLSRVAIMTTAYRRPYYFEPVLQSWLKADGIADVRRFVIALGASDRFDRQMALINRLSPKFPCPVEVRMQSERANNANGMHTAIAEAMTACFADPDVDFVVAGEEDVMVSSDILQYFGWARETFANDPSVLLVCAHSQAGQSWDAHESPDDAGADQEAVRLKRYFNGYCWSTWAGRWAKVLEPMWDYECNLGGPLTSGYDWRIQRDIIPSGPYVTVVPDASRSRNIGKLEGWAENAETFGWAAVKSFRERRENPQYRLVSE